MPHSKKPCRPVRINPQVFMREQMAHNAKTDARLAEIVRLCKGLGKKGDQLMATVKEGFDEVKAELAGLKSDIAAEHVEVQTNAATAQAAHDALMAKIAELEATIAAGGAVTVADMGELKASVVDARSGVTAISDAIAPAPTEP